MIVKCDQCQTRFKIPDEKVTEKGVKVRCTKCQHTFKVNRRADSVLEPTPPPSTPPRIDTDPFGRFDESGGSDAGIELTRPGVFVEGIEASRRGIFDMPTRVSRVPDPPAAAPEADPDPFGSFTASEASASLLADLPPPPVEEQPEEPARRSARSTPPAPPPTPDPARGSETARSGAGKKLVGIGLNLGLASILLVGILFLGTIYLNGGDTSALSFHPLQALFAGPGDLVAEEVSNGLYDTLGDKPVFYVRGEVENRGKHPARVQVDVEILDGSLSVSRAQGIAGAAPTPEQLHQVRTAGDASSLGARLAEGAVSIAPGQRAPFFVVFYEYPPELSDYRLKLSLREAPANH
jgi:predicted Zn finger-like uncharacterized protein